MTDHHVCKRYHPHTTRERTSEVVHGVREYAGGGPPRCFSADLICKTPDGPLRGLNEIMTSTGSASVGAASLACSTVDVGGLRISSGVSTHAAALPGVEGCIGGAAALRAAGKERGYGVVADVSGSRAPRMYAMEGRLVDGGSMIVPGGGPDGAVSKAPGASPARPAQGMGELGGAC